MTEQPLSDYDGAWKAALDVYLQEFLELCFPAIHAAIDWSRPYHFLETELQRASSADYRGRRTVDKLVEVWGQDGVTAWVLIHIEIQSQNQADFAQRMFQYHYRLRDRFERAVVSIAVLADDRASWRPEIYETALWGCEVRFRFPTIKLLDFRERLAELEANRNPVAALVLAHLAAQQTRADPARRLQEKLAIVRLLYDRGYSPEEVRRAFSFVDWLLRLPDGLKTQFAQELRSFEEERQMTYITSIEEIGIEKGIERGRVEGRVEGRAEGLREGIVLALDLKFGEAAQPIIAEIQAITDMATLERLKAAIKPAQALDDIRRVYTPTTDSH